MPLFIKGIKYSFPPKIRIHKDKTSFTWSIKMTRPHNVKDAHEQADWLKICGVSAKLNAQIDSTMLGGRWNPDLFVWEFTPYTHVLNIDKPIYASKPTYSAKLNDEFNVHLKVNILKSQYEWSLPNSEKVIHPFTGDKRWLRQISAYAGGTLPSPATYWFKAKLINNS